LPCIVSAGWFEDFKVEATKEQRYQFLYEMPKGGDFHHHLSGPGFAERWFDLALSARADGYVYHTKVKLNSCREHGWQGFKTTPYQLIFQTVVQNS
jgi:adenosine deaminase CECR1